jgi:hypothetical protein
VGKGKYYKKGLIEMKAKYLLIALCTAIFVLCVEKASEGAYCSGGRVPQPQLVSPISEIVDLTGKETLEFKWIKYVSGTRAAYYDFRLYKGYVMNEGTLIFKKRLSGDESKISLDSKMFDKDKVYTWSLRMQILGSGKSDKSHYSFKVRERCDLIV